jgi:flagellar biosynthesis protein FliR
MTLDLAALIGGKVFAYLLIFCRVGSIMMVMPGFGETFVPAHIRLQFALLTSLVLLPFLAPQLPAMPESALRVTEYLGIELGIGIFIGTIMRLLLSALEVAGMLMALQMGLSNAMVLNPTIQTQGSIPGAILSLLGVILIFETGLLDMVMQSFTHSYTVFKPGVWLPIGDMMQFLSKTVNESFSIALRLVAPFMILGIVFQITGGLLVKMIPQMQIFFVLMPLQILFGLAIFAASLGTMLTVWGKGFEETISHLFGA